MYKKLNNTEISKFIKKYLPQWTNDIKDVSIINYGLVKEYLVNEHYLVIDYVYKIVEKDLQES